MASIEYFYVDMSTQSVVATGVCMEEHKAVMPVPAGCILATGPARVGQHWTGLAAVDIEGDLVDFEDRRAAKLAQVNAAYSAATEGLVAEYPTNERLTWQDQEREAIAWTADNTASTPVLSGICAARGISLGDLAARVIANAAGWRDAAGRLTGLRQYYESLVKAAVDDGDLADVQIEF